MHRSVTHIIHNGTSGACIFRLAMLSTFIAWKINLNLSLTSFEDGISGVRALVDFAITSPLMRIPHLLFVSSISVFISVYFTSTVPPFSLMSIFRFREQWLCRRGTSAKSRDPCWHRLLGIEMGRGAYPRCCRGAHSAAARSCASGTGMWRRDWHLERKRVVPVARQVCAHSRLSAESRWCK